MQNPIYILFCVVLLTACATPTQPTGGEPDRTGPVILSTEPEDGSVNFAEDQIRFNFDKYISRGTFLRAFSIEPDVGITYRVRWRGRSAIVRFEDELPDSTTLIFRLDTDLSDANNNRLRQPFTLATSTGPTIDKGEIKGRVLNKETGRAWTDGIVLLYRHPFSFDESADYAIQPDTGGHIHFNYLREATYKAFWVDDRNRNKRWDRVSEAARPFPVESVVVIDGEISSLDKAFIAIPDTISPDLQGIGLLSDVRMRLRFSEAVIYSEDAEITVLDSLNQTVQTAIPLYTEREQQNILLARLGDALDTESDFTLSMSGITDKAGNPPIGTDRQVFSGSAASDTTMQRIIRNLTEYGLYPADSVILQYATIITDAAVTDSLIIIEDELTHTGWDSIAIVNNLLYIYPDNTWREGSKYQLRAWDPRLQDYTRYDLNIWHSSILGDLELTVSDDTTEVWHYRLISQTGEDARTGFMTGHVLLENLPEGNYILQAFHDPDRTGTWDAGSVDPYRKPASIFVESTVSIRNRMTTELAVGSMPDVRDRSDLEENGEPEPELEPEQEQEPESEPDTDMDTDMDTDTDTDTDRDSGIDTQ